MRTGESHNITRKGHSLMVFPYLGNQISLYVFQSIVLCGEGEDLQQEVFMLFQ